MPLHGDTDRNSDVGITAVVQVIAVVDVGHANVVVVIPVVLPVFRPWVDKTYPTALILEARVTTNGHEGEAIDAKPMVPAEVSSISVVGNAVAVVGATLLPVAVVRVPAL